MRARRLLALLVAGSTYRRGLYLVLGGVLALPYALLGVVLAQLLVGPRAQPGLGLLLLGVTLALAGAPAFVRGTRALEITAVRLLLDVDLPDPPQLAAQSRRAALETRLRGALWYFVHLAVGAVVVVALLVILPMASVFVAQQVGAGREALTGLRVGPLDEGDGLWLSLLGLVLLVTVAYAVAGLGALAAVMAPVLLGPSAAERIAALEARAAGLAERNRLARELHDSVGHALAITTVQAAAARQLLGTDAAFVDRALQAIEDAGRTAAAELDQVLGLLRADRPPPGAEITAGPARSGPDATGAPGLLHEVDRLAADTRAAGVDVRVELAPATADLPVAVSREGYRIVQECLTNALRHGGSPVTVRVVAADTGVLIDVANPVRDRPARPGSGRGLAGVRERVLLLGGEVTAGLDGGLWRTTVRLPVSRAGGER